MKYAEFWAGVMPALLLFGAVLALVLGAILYTMYRDRKAARKRHDEYLKAPYKVEPKADPTLNPMVFHGSMRPARRHTTNERGRAYSSTRHYTDTPPTPAVYPARRVYEDDRRKDDSIGFMFGGAAYAPMPPVDLTPESDTAPAALYRSGGGGEFAGGGASGGWEDSRSSSSSSSSSSDSSSSSSDSSSSSSSD